MKTDKIRELILNIVNGELLYMKEMIIFVKIVVLKTEKENTGTYILITLKLLKFFLLLARPNLNLPGPRFKRSHAGNCPPLKPCPGRKFPSPELLCSVRVRQFLRLKFAEL